MAVKKENNITEYKKILSTTLEPYKGSGSRTRCPRCGKLSFSNYIWLDTGFRVQEGILGRCNHSVHCGYWEKPDSEDYKNRSMYIPTSKVKKELQNLQFEIPSSIPYVHLFKSRLGVEDNLRKFLSTKFNPNKVLDICQKYNIGSFNSWDNDKCTIFWQVDEFFNIRSGKIIEYDNNGKRVKQPFPKVGWFHSFQRYPDFNLRQCFFGEHLLSEISSNNIDTINIVESEKTALICTLASKNSYFIATGGLQNINEQRLQPFKSKKLIFHPDKGKSFKMWEDKLDKFRDDYNIEICNFLENTSLDEGEDLGDYILNQKDTINVNQK